MTEDDDENKDEETKKPFETQRVKRLKEEEKNRPYFEEIDHLLQNSKQLKQKAEAEKREVQQLLKKKEQELKKAKDPKNKQLAQADCLFLKTALSVLPSIKRKINGDIAKLTLIKISKIKMPYDVLIDFERNPLPSERAKNKNKDKDKDKNKDKNNDTGKNNKNNENKGKDTPNKQKETPEQKAGRDIYSLSRKGKNRNLPQAKKPARKKTQPQQSDFRPKALPDFDRGY